MPLVRGCGAQPPPGRPQVTEQGRAGLWVPYRKRSQWPVATSFPGYDAQGTHRPGSALNRLSTTASPSNLPALTDAHCRSRGLMPRRGRLQFAQQRPRRCYRGAAETRGPFPGTGWRARTPRHRSGKVISSRPRLRRTGHAAALRLACLRSSPLRQRPGGVPAEEEGAAGASLGHCDGSQAGEDHLLEPYTDAGAEYYEAQHHERALRNARRRARKLGYQLVPLGTKRSSSQITGLATV